jgi:hypothetical protein
MIRLEDSSSSQAVSTLIPVVLDLPHSSRANDTFPVVPGLISSDGVSDGTRGMKDSEVSKGKAASLSSRPRAVTSGSGSSGLIGWSQTKGFVGVKRRAIPGHAHCEDAVPSATKPEMSEELLERDAERDELRMNDGEIGFPIAVLGRSLVVPLPCGKLRAPGCVQCGVCTRPAGESST